MSASDCQRWMELTDQAAVGAYLTDQEQAWLAQHASGCSQCGAEQQFYTSLHAALGRPEALVVPAPATPAPVRRASSRRFVALALAAGVALAVGSHLVLRRSPAPVASLSPALTAQVLLASGEAHLGAAPAEAGQVVPQGERLSTAAGLACMGIANSVEVCLDGASTATFALGDPDQILVYLEKGALLARLDHQPPGRTFSVRAAGAEVQAVGTKFSVRLADDGDLRVHLHEGRLALRAASRVSTDLAAPAQASIAQDIRVEPITPAATREDQPLSELVDVTREESGATLLLTTFPPGADVLVDNVAVGQTPLSMFLAATAHIRLSLPGYAPVSEWIEVGDQPRIERAVTLTALPATPPAATERPAPVRHAAAHVSPDQLLAKAQTLRARGEYQACAQLYRRLWSEFPGSEAAKVSMISLGELQLVRTRNPASALDAFNAYLRLGGPLEREARFGKIRALRMLERDEEADAETARFLRDYPTGIQATTLRRKSYGK
jgi:ferric-dicitrate binding protein FerR (iron transport regulator)